MAIENIQIEAKASIPPGVIVAWSGGYFGDGSNGSYTSVEDSTVSSSNIFLSNYGWAVCDGSEKNESNSYFFNGAGRHLPNLTDDRFLMGGTSNGLSGGSNAMLDHTHTNTLVGDSHTHTMNHTHTPFNSGSNGSHTHVTTGSATGITLNAYVSGAYKMIWASTAGPGYTLPYGGAHVHNITIPAYSGSSGGTAVNISGTIGTGSAASSTENRPKYLSCLYIIKVK